MRARKVHEEFSRSKGWEKTMDVGVGRDEEVQRYAEEVTPREVWWLCNYRLGNEDEYPKEELPRIQELDSVFGSTIRFKGSFSLKFNADQEHQEAKDTIRRERKKGRYTYDLMADMAWNAKGDTPAQESIFLVSSKYPIKMWMIGPTDVGHLVVKLMQSMRERRGF